MKWTFRVLLLSVVLLFVLPVHAADGVSDQHFARLAKGINLPFWFWYAPDNVDTRFSDADFQTIHDLGFTFVRIPIDLGYVMDTTSDDLLNADHLAHVDAGIDRLFAQNLAVIVDIHSTSIADSDASNYSGALEDPEFVDLFVSFWQSFAAHFQDRDPEMLFFGPMNEPVFYDDPSAWLPIQDRLLAAIREVAPENTLIATGARWSGRETLMQMSALEDPNLVYDFHFYDPFPFTHQGATWAGDAVVSLRNVPYPSSPELIAPLLTNLSGEARRTLRDYGTERWDAARIDSEIGKVADWAEENGVRIISTEFGVYGDFAPPVDRALWIHDTRTAFESHGIGWAMWEYDSSFGIVKHSGRNIVINEAVADALGLNIN